MADLPPLDAAYIEHKLNEWLEVEFSFLKTSTPAQAIAQLPRPDQDFMLMWVQRMSSTNIELAYQFTVRAIEFLNKQERRVIEAWVLHAMDTYDQRGLHPAMEFIKNIEHFIQYSHDHSVGTVLQDHATVLLHFCHGLSGRQLKIEEAEQAYTDTQTIYLPPVIATLATPEDNFLLYKASAAYLWAQTRFGTFHVPLYELAAQHPHPEPFLALFHALETVRLEACIARELPGLYRVMQRIQEQLNEKYDDASWQSITQPLIQPGATSQDTLALTHEHLHKINIPAPQCFQGTLNPERVAECLKNRVPKEKAAFRVALSKILEDLKKEEAARHEAREHQFRTRKISDHTLPEGFRMELTLDDQPVPLPDHLSKLLTSIQLDLGDIPDEYLVAAGPGEYDPSLYEEKEVDPDEVWQGTYHEEGAFLYNEWDFRRQHYRKNWCAVREKTISPVYDDFIQNTLRKYSGLIKHLRKSFEAMRDEDRVLNRQTYGDGIDIDALVQALAESRNGSEMSDQLFTRLHRNERNIAVVFMVDMSGSTKGWINEAERESLVLLAEALETLGDRYAIYGFSGMARKRCEIYKIKEFHETYNEEIRARITGITPKDYTRMGFAIRHLTKILQDVEARTRILITISDGKPDDYDNYRGAYGIEDTRRALVEARRSGIHPYCITIDTEAKDYLPHMYGDAAFTVIDKVNQLPLKVSDIYRRLTS
ncbi:MAG: VWA domain-containing protein [Gammaproteobacteria bacterium]|nr:VWA domain-containing protein [Gammaproteobacteria bacterium]